MARSRAPAWFQSGGVPSSVSPSSSVVIWATKDAVRLGLPGEAKGEACSGCPPLERLFEQFAQGGGDDHHNHRGGERRDRAQTRIAPERGQPAEEGQRLATCVRHRLATLVAVSVNGT